MDYYDAVKDAESSFGTNDVLYRSEPQPGIFYGIEGKAGGNAVVFGVTTGNRTGQEYGLKCWIVEVPELVERYVPISKRLAEDQCRKCGWNVHPHFESLGIQVKDDWWPYLKMDWIRGTPLDRYVASHLADPPALGRVANSFYRLAVNLRKLGIAHGDLQHANIIVSRTGGIRLVDYDGMYVGDMPDLQGLPGHYNYYHPEWSPESFGPTNDYFTIWVIYCSLKALSLDSRLWAETTNNSPDRDYILLTAQDYLALIRQGDARSSRGLSAMLDSRSDDVQRIGNLLAEALAVSWQDTPLLTVSNGAIVTPLTPAPRPNPRPTKKSKVAPPDPGKPDGTQVRLPGPPRSQRPGVTTPTRLAAPKTVPPKTAPTPIRLPGPPMTSRGLPQTPDVESRQAPSRLPGPRSSDAHATQDIGRPRMQGSSISRIVAIAIIIMLTLFMVGVPLLLAGK